MDYKELIENFRSLADRWEQGEQLLLNGELCLQDALRNAAAAIETLTSERDAAIKDLTELGQESPDSCHLCKHLPCTEKYGRCIGWQWRGPAEV